MLLLRTMHCPFVMMQTLFFLSAIWTLFTLEEDRSLHVFLLHVGSQSIRSPVEVENNRINIQDGQTKLSIFFFSHGTC